MTKAVIEVDREVEVAYVSLRRGKVAQTREIVANQIFADYDAEENLLGVEILGPIDVGSLATLANGNQAKAKLRKLLRS